jgi:predicted amino acid dehydrogenase
MKHIVSISLTSSAQNYDARVHFMGQDIRISHYGADFDSKVMASLIRQFDGDAYVIALSGIHSPVQIGRATHTHRASEALKAEVKESLLVTGEKLRNTYMPWVLREFVRKNPGIVTKRRVAFYSGLLDRASANAISEITDRMVFLDPFFHLGVPLTLSSFESLERYTKRILPFLKRRPLEAHISDRRSRKRIGGVGLGEFERADVYVTRATMLERFGFDHLRGKTLLVDTVGPRLLQELRDAGVSQVLRFRPDLEVIRQEPRINFATLEGLLQCLKAEREPISDDDILTWIQELELKPTFNQLTSVTAGIARKFAFVIHPLSARQIFLHPTLKPIYPYSKPLERPLERAVSAFPGIHYGYIRGIRSASTGEETEGLIYSLFETPRMMLEKNPEEIYKRLVRVAEVASSKGADIIGLGAYTKIAGDGGVTVAERSPIPVTTGNSLSAAATLWAARDACAKLGFLVTPKPGERLRSKAMVIGATGSIGAVSAKLLAHVFEELVICARRGDMLLQLKAEIESIVPRARVTVATNPNLHAPHCDLIVTSTSSHDKKVLDIMTVKPGCVVCDVSRPLDISEEDAQRRPDILVVESGEIELPGNIQVTCDIGTPDDAVYACLAETALLALEGRMESFTLSRNISYTKVNEIYDMARKHGAKLAAIRGHAGIITTREIDLCREHAQRELAKRSKAQRH